MFRKSAALFVCALAVPIVLSAAERLTGGSGPMATLAASYDAPVLGKSTSVNGMQVTIGNLTLDLASGSAASVMAGNETIGLFFDGKGHYSYHSTDLQESSLVLFEAKKLGRSVEKAADGTVTVKGEFAQAYVRSLGVELPPLTGGSDSGALFVAFGEHNGRFANTRWTPASHFLLRHHFDVKTAPVAVVELDGSNDNGFVLDGIDAKSQDFYALITDMGASQFAELKGARFPIPIAGEPIGRKRSAFLEPPYLLTDVDYTLVAGDKESGKLSVTESIIARTAAESVFRFDLQSGFWDTSGHYRKLHVDSVSDAAGRKLDYNFDHGSIVVGLPESVAVNAATTVHFELSGDFLVHPNGDSYFQLGTTPWFPQPDLNGQYYTVHSVVKVKKPWIAFAPGTSSRREEGDYNVVESKVDKPVQFAVVHAGKYAIAEEKHDDVTIHVASYAMSNDRAMKQLSKLAYLIIKFYEPWLGPFPFKEFNIIEMNDFGYGQAPPGTMFITKEAFNPAMGDDNRLYSKGINQRFAHEIAHQYWGMVVKMGSREEQWVTEAFAEYCSSQVVMKLKGQQGYDALLSSWHAGAKDAGTFAPIALANRISIPNNSEAASMSRIGLIYDKGAWVLAVLHKQMGDQKFFSMLRTIQANFAWRFLTTNDIVNVASRMDPGPDYKQFFDRYFWGTEMPVLPVAAKETK
jgi:hypothetical protein